MATNTPPSPSPSEKKAAATRKKFEPLALLASALASVTSMFIGSLFGDSGTLIGTAVGSIVSGSAVVLYENFALFTASRLKKTTGRLYAHDPDATRVIPAHQLRKHRKHLVLAGGLLTAGLCAAGCFALLSLTEAASGKTLHGLTTDSKDYGYTLGTNTTTPPSPAPSQPALVPSALPGTTTPTQSYNPSYSPAPASSPSVLPSSLPVTQSPTVVPTSAPPVEPTEPVETQAPDPAGSPQP